MPQPIRLKLGSVDIERLTKPNPLRGIETAAQIKKELKRTEFDGTFCKKFKLQFDKFSYFFR